jgi:2-methylcitrate dehydratase PrpD
MPGEHTRAMAEYIAASPNEAVPADVQQKVQMVVLDALGCGLLGSRMSWTEAIVATLRDTEAPGPALVWGTDARFSASNAALANGTSVHGFELDDVGSGGHNGSVTVTSALALAQSGCAMSGAELIRAVTTGIEVAARVEASCHDIPRTHMGFHGPGLWGVFASMGTCATILRLSADQAVNAIGTAAQQAASLMGTQGGGMGKRMLAGKAAHSGMLAAQLAAHGFTNVDNIFECGYGSFPSVFCGGREDYTLDDLDKDFGETWLTRGVNFKLWAARVPIHPSLEAIKAIRREDPLDPADVEHVLIRLPLGSFRAVGFAYKPTTVTSAQLNLQYCAAIMVLENDVFVPQFTEAKIGSQPVLDMVARIEIVHDPELDKIAGDRISPETRVEVKLKDGRTLASIGRVRGSSGDPVSREEVVEKFKKTSAGSLNAEEAQQVIDWCDQLPVLTDATRLLEPIEALTLHGRPPK